MAVGEPTNEAGGATAVTGTPSERLPVTAAILAGGRSIRMGTDKTLLTIGGEPMITRVTAAALEYCEQVVVITNFPENLEGLTLPASVEIIADDTPLLGPLGGLSTALAHAKHEWVLALAADMPWVSRDIVAALWDARGDADAVIPVTDSGIEPLLALYRVATAGPVAHDVLASGRRRIAAMFPRLAVADLPLSLVQELDPTFSSFFNINTPADLAEARARSSETELDRFAAAPVAGAPAAAPMPPERATAGPQSAIDERTAPLAPSGETQRPPAHAPETDLARAARERRPVRILHAGRDRSGMPSERPITLFLNDIEVATVQATTQHVQDMAIGFLVTEGLLKDRDAFQNVTVDDKYDLVYVTSEESVPEDLVHDTSKRYVTSGCGKGITFSSIGHARGLDRITHDLTVEPVDLYDWIAEMASRSEDYRETGGYHSCGLVIDRRLVLVREDVGRHNAADKLIGRAWLDRLPMDRGVLLSTGRLSYEMTVKAAKVRIPVVASRSAATDLSVQIADELGITLVGYVRGGKILIYTHPYRIAGATDVQ